MNTTPTTATLDETRATELLRLSHRLAELSSDISTAVRIGAPVDGLSRLADTLREHATEAERLQAAAPSDGLTPEQRRIGDAIARLQRSERGHAALVGLRQLLDRRAGYALGLDDSNWAALTDLVAACRTFGGAPIRDLLPAR